MVVLRSSEDDHVQKKRCRASSFKGDQIRLNGLYPDSNSIRRKYESFPDMLMCLKDAAINPCSPRASLRSFKQSWAQILKARKILVLTTNELPWKKRKLDKFLHSTSTATSMVAEKSERSCMELIKGKYFFASSTPRLVNYSDSTESFNQPAIQRIPGSLVTLLKSRDMLQGKQVSSDSYFQDDEMDWTSLPNREFPPLINSDESMNGSNPSSSGKLTFHDTFLLDLDDSVSSSHPEKSVQQNRQIPRRSIRLLNFIGDYLPRMAIPIGPRFQVDIPDWTSPSDKDNPYGGDCGSDNSRWLGTRIWPTEGGTAKITSKVIGKGRPNCCSCLCSRSAECIKHHIMEESLRLRINLGPAFLIWKFDEMGEEVSKFWTFEEQRTFSKLNPMSRGKSFWKRTLKCFPSKCKKSIVSYYFNVFIPRHLSMQTRSASEIVDSDDDNDDDDALVSMDSRRRCQNENVSLSNSKDVKTRYLIRPR